MSERSGRNVVSMTTNGRITVPAAIRRELGLRPGDDVVFRISGTQVLLAAASESVAAKPKAGRQTVATSARAARGDAPG